MLFRCRNNSSLCRPSGYADVGAGSREFPGLRDETVGIIARREAGASVAVRTASTTGDDGETTVADSVMVVQALIRPGVHHGPMLDDRPGSGNDQHALPARQSVGCGRRSLEIIPTTDPMDCVLSRKRLPERRQQSA